MQEGKASGAGVVLALAFVVAVGNLTALLFTVDTSREAFAALLTQGSAAPVQALLAQTLRSYPGAVSFLVAAPFALGVISLLLLRRSAPASRAVEQAPPAVEAKPVSALRLLALLQQEARLVDFISEDLGTYDDAQVGAAAREIHAGCRKALQDRVRLERVFDAEEGGEVVVDEGFDAGAVRLTGNVAGAPPFRGTLQHAGWRAADVRLPETAKDVDPAILAPAEVEIP